MDNIKVCLKHRLSTRPLLRQRCAIWRRHWRRQADNIKVCLKHRVSTRPLLRQRCAIWRRHWRRQVDNIKVCLKHRVSTRPLLRQRCAIWRRHWRRQVDNIKVCLKHRVSTRPLWWQRCVIIDDYPKCSIMVILNTKPAKPCTSAHIHLLSIMDFGHRNSMTWTILFGLFPATYCELYTNLN